VYIETGGLILGRLSENNAREGMEETMTQVTELTEAWTKQWGSAEWDIGESVALDSNDNIYVTGWTEGDIDGNDDAGKADIVLTKWSGDGTEQWTRQWGSADLDYGNSVAIDSNDNIYVTGTTGGDLDGNNNAGWSDIFLTKWDADGTEQWTRQWGSEETDYGNSVTVDSVGNIYVTGTTGGNLDGNTNAGWYDIFLTKWSGDGTKQWTRQWGSEETDSVQSASLDSKGNIYVTGWTEGGLSGNAEAVRYEIFLTKWSGEDKK